MAPGPALLSVPSPVASLFFTPRRTSSTSFRSRSWGQYLRQQPPDLRDTASSARGPSGSAAYGEWLLQQIVTDSSLVARCDADRKTSRSFLSMPCIAAGAEGVRSRGPLSLPATPQTDFAAARNCGTRRWRPRSSARSSAADEGDRQPAQKPGRATRGET
jgi:hypothetical protein